MNVRDPYRWPRRVLTVGIMLLAVPSYPRAQLMQRGNALPEVGVAAQAPQPAAGARVLTLDEALELAEPKSEQVTIAEAGVTRAESQEQRVRSEWLPQVSAVGLLRPRAGVGVLRPVRRVWAGVHSLHGESRRRRCTNASRRSSARCKTARRPAMSSAAAARPTTATATMRCRSASRTPIA